MIHTTVELYANGEYKINGVLPEHLNKHINYNKTYRCGRSLFVDSKCIYNGYQSEKVVKAFEDKIKGDPNFIRNKCTAPYS